MEDCRKLLALIDSRFTEDTTVLEDGDTAVRVFYQAAADEITMAIGLQSTGMWNRR